MYICPRCGEAIRVGQEACGRCGLRLDAAGLAGFEAQRAGPYPVTGAPAPVPAYAWPGARRRPRLLPWIIGCAVLLALGCGGAGVFVATSGVQLFQGMAQDTLATSAIVDRFMRAGVNDDPQAAFALFSPSSTTASPGSIATLFSTRRDYFSGYKSAKIDSFNMNSGTSGTTAYAGGSLSYTGRSDVGFTARFVKENNQWKLISIQLSEGVGK